MTRFHNLDEGAKRRAWFARVLSFVDLLRPCCEGLADVHAVETRINEALADLHAVKRQRLVEVLARLHRNQRYYRLRSEGPHVHDRKIH